MRYIAALLIATALLTLAAEDSSGGDRGTCEDDGTTFKKAYEAGVRGSNDEQRQLLRRVEQLIATHAEGPPACRGQLMEFRTYLLTQDGRYDEAIGTVNEFEQLPTEALPIDLRARMIRFRGYLLSEIGEITQSAQAYFRAAALTNELPAHTAAMTLIEASTSARELGDWGRATAYEAEAERVLQDSLSARPDLIVRLGRVLVSRGHLLSERMKREPDIRRRAELARALEITADSALTLLGPPARDIDNARRAMATGHKALAASWLDRHDEARQLIARRLSLAESSRELLPSGVHEAALQQSDIAERAGDSSTAWTAALRARSEAAGLEDPALEATALERLGELTERGDDLASAAMYYGRAIELREIGRARLEVQDWSASAFGTMQKPYRGLARVRAKQGDVRAAFSILDRTRARFLQDLQLNAQARATLTGANRAAADSLLDALERVRVAELYSNRSVVARSAAADTAASLQSELDLLLSRTSATRQPELDIPSLQRTLGESGQVLLSYLIDEQGSLAFVVSADTVVAQPLNTDRIEIELFLERIGHPWSGGEPDPGLNLIPLHQLYSRLIDPVKQFVKQGEALIVIPDGALAGLPFAMLLEQPPRSTGPQPFLIRSHPVSNELAAILIGQQTPQNDRPLPLNLVAFGRSDFSDLPAIWTSRERGEARSLPAVVTEIDKIKSIVPRSETALNGAATEARLYGQLDRTRILHLASHAEADAAFPLYSRVMLWDDPDAPDDGVLHLYELQNRNVPVDLVVLSGCSTASGQIYDGEGALGMQFAVRAAGAQSTLATLWAVDDEATTFLMESFYRGLRSGLTRDRALQQAQVSYLDTHEGMDASPFYWAAPVLSGATSTIVMGDDPQYFGVGMGLMGVVVATLIGALVWRRRQTEAHA